MKKLLAIALVLCMMVLSSCGVSPENPSGDAPGVGEQENGDAQRC